MSDEPKIAIPEPDGQRRSAICFSNGKTQPVDLSCDELKAALELFAKDPQAPMFLRLINPGHGLPFYLSRAALETIEFIDVRWIQVLRRDETPPPPLWTPDQDSGPTVNLRRVR